MKRLFSILVSLYVAYVVFTTSCANPGMPTGGDKDTIPPVVLKTIPAFNARNHTDPNISITFDEFIVATDVSNKLVVSPPLGKRPTVRTRGKTLIVNLGDSLRANRTYSLNFQNSIVDNNEKNPLTDFRFAFSTGPDFDSLMVGGYVLNSENIEPVEGAVVILYADNDSIPPFRDGIPDYIAMTNKEGFYAITNIAPGKYHLFGLYEEDNSLNYNQAGERIAFYDSLVVPVYPDIKEILEDSLVVSQIADSLLNASIGKPLDSLLVGMTMVEGVVETVDEAVAAEIAAEGLHGDSVKSSHSPIDHLHPYYLFLFTEDIFDQYLDSYGRNVRNMINFYFSGSVTDSFRIDMLSPSPPDHEWSYLEKNATRDSLILWVNDTTISRHDTLRIRVQYQVLDSLKNLTLRKDTLSLVYKQPQQPRERRRRDQDETPPTPHFSFTVNARDGFDPFRTLTIVTPEPLEHFDKSMVRLYQMVDSVEQVLNVKMEQDSLLRRRFKINHQWEFEGVYRLAIDSAAAVTFTGMPSNAVGQKFSIQKESFYGRIFLNITNVTDNSIVQLLRDSDKEEVVWSITTSADGEVMFPFVKPDKYRIKLIVDRNNNGRWDTGNLDERIQPERIFYFDKILKTKSNFDIHESWTLPGGIQTVKKFLDDDKSGEDTKTTGTGGAASSGAQGRRSASGLR